MKIRKVSNTSVKKDADLAELYPRTLVISPNALNPMASGGGVLMSNLFRNWPSGKVASIYSMRHLSADSTLCSVEYRLYPRITTNPAEWVQRSYDYVTGKNESLDGVASLKVPDLLWRWIQAFAPQVIYSHLGPLYMTRLTNLIVKRLSVPLVVHVMDDYVEEWPVNGHSQRNIVGVARLLNSWNKRAFREALASASAHLAISQRMADVYSTRYGYSFDVVHNGITPEEWPARESDAGQPHSPFRILYSGSISQNNSLESLGQLRDAVVALASRGLSIRMEISSPLGDNFRPFLEAPPVVTFAPTVPRSALSQRLSEFDLLTIPYNFDDAAVRLFQLSWPTKLPEYMMSGTPILIYAPAGMAFVEYAREQKCALIVDEIGQLGLQAALQRLIEDDELRRQLADRARAVALRDESNQEIRHKFEHVIQNAAIGSSAFASKPKRR